jgi:ubiquinone/menaquinone biosynthesis C-methylase UbiE
VPEFARVFRESAANAAATKPGLDATLADYAKHVEFAGRMLVDVGCSCHPYLQSIARQHQQLRVIGLDIDTAAIAIAADAARGIENLTYCEGSWQDLPKFKERADIVSCCHALHELEDAQQFCTAAYAALKKGGLLYVEDFNREYLSQHAAFGKDVQKKPDTPRLSTILLEQGYNELAAGRIDRERFARMLLDNYEGMAVLTLTSMFAAYTPTEIEQEMTRAGYREIITGVSADGKMLHAEGWKF